MNSRKSDHLTIFLADMRTMAQDPPFGLPADSFSLHTLSSGSSAKKDRVASRRLVAYALASYLRRAPSPLELAGETRTQNGKPGFPCFPDFHYNISHSGDYAVCAVSDKPVGVDIQKIPDNPQHPLKIARHFLSEEEKSALQSLCRDSIKERSALQSLCRDSIESRDSGKEPGESALCVLFARYWTAREAYIKLTGAGLSESFDRYKPDLEAGQILVSDKISAFLSECEAPPGYRMTVCSYEKISGCDIRRIRI